MTILTTLLYEGLKRERIPLYLRWIRHYTELRDTLKWDRMVFIDNASSVETILAITDAAPEADTIHYAKRYERVSMHVYPYCWRAMQTAQAFRKMYRADRIYGIDPDCYILSRKCAEELAALRNGWYSLWSGIHAFPAIECTVVHGTGLDAFERFEVPNWHNDKPMENMVPATPVKHFRGDRYGEMGIADIDPSWDFVAQLDRMDLTPVIH